MRESEVFQTGQEITFYSSLSNSTVTSEQQVQVQAEQVNSTLNLSTANEPLINSTGSDRPSERRVKVDQGFKIKLRADRESLF